MAVTAYCTSDEVESVLSENGVLWAVDDDRSGTTSAGESGFIDDALERATVIINQYVAMIYSLPSLLTNTWTKWACAVLAAQKLCRRHGNGSPDGLTLDCEEVFAFLELVRKGQAVIPADGEADALPLATNAGLVMSNLRIDQRFPTAKVRVVQRISTGPSASRLRRYFDYQSMNRIE